MLCLPLALAACNQDAPESESISPTSSEQNETPSASVDDTPDVSTSETVSGTPDLILGEPLSFHDSITSGYGTVTFQNIELRNTCYNELEEKELPPLDHEGNPTGKIYLHTTVVLEADPNSYVPSPLPDSSLIDGEGFTISGRISDDCVRDERAGSTYWPEANPGEKVLVERWQEVPEDLRALRFSGHEYSLNAD